MAAGRRFLGPIAAAALVVACAVGANRPVARIVVAKESFELRAASELVACYRTAGTAKPYFWPVHAPGGMPLTRGWPMEAGSSGSHDHPYQRSLWIGYGDVNGVDFWSEGRRHGDIVCVEVGAPQERLNRATIRTRNEWRSAEGKALLEEERSIQLHEMDRAHLLVLDLELRAPAGPVVFGDTKEGFVGLRVAEALTGAQAGKIRNADGKSGEWACWGRPSDWCDFSNERMGVALFDDPANRPRACWHCRGYGLLAANPFGRQFAGFPAMLGRQDIVRLAKGEGLHLRYGVLLHLAGVNVGAAYRTFAAERWRAGSTR